MLAASSDIGVAWIGAGGIVFVALVGFLGVWVQSRTRKVDSKVDTAVDHLVDRLVRVEGRADDCEDREKTNLRRIANLERKLGIEDEP